jgi:hypothetical protein
VTHPDVIGVYDDHPVIRLESQLLEVGIDRTHTPAPSPSIDGIQGRAASSLSNSDEM